jgi:outer membrane protein assembly factor BamA
VANVPGFLPSDTLLQPNLFDQSNQTKRNLPADARTKQRKYQALQQGVDINSA